MKLQKEQVLDCKIFHDVYTEQGGWVFCPEVYLKKCVVVNAGYNNLSYFTKT